MSAVISRFQLTEPHNPVFVGKETSMKKIASLVMCAVLLVGMLGTSAPRESYAAKVDLSGRGVGYSTVIYDNTNGFPTSDVNAVADTFDAMYSSRPYRKRMELSDIVAEIRRCSGTQLNEKVVDALMALIDEGVFKEEDRPN